MGPDRAELARDMALRPLLRWLASLAEVSLVCGRNRIAIQTCERLLELDPRDMAGARLTCALAHAKLEDGPGLDALVAQYAQLRPARPADDAWTQLSRIALLHKRCDLDAAETGVARLLATYPDAGVALIQQRELPDGLFARIATIPYSEDEAVLAVSEATVLLQEGNDRDKGVLGSWLAEVVSRLDPESAEEAFRESIDDAAPIGSEA